MFCAGPLTWFANTCARGNTRMLQKMWVTFDKLHRCKLLKTDSAEGG